VQTGSLGLHLLQDPPSSYNSVRQQQHQQQQQDPQQQQQRSKVSRAWPRPQQDVCKAISLRLKRADSTADVLAVIGDHSQRFNEVGEMLPYQRTTVFALLLLFGMMLLGGTVKVPGSVCCRCVSHCPVCIAVQLFGLVCESAARFPLSFLNTAHPPAVI
jgi:hypothetical protein